MPKSRDLNPGTASFSRSSRTCKAAADKNSKVGSVSKYFTRNKNDETNLRSSESIAGEDSTPRNLRKIKTVILSDDDDFQSPKPTKKLARIFTNPTEPQTNKRITKRVLQKGKRGTKKDSLQKTIEDAFKKKDVHAEHLQMAIALSVSAQEAQRAEEEKEISRDRDCRPVAASSQEVRENVRKTLEQYGFRSGGGKDGTSEWSGFLKNAEATKRKKKSRYQHVKPILFLRTDATRNEMINSRIAQILVESSTEHGNILEIQENNPKRMDEIYPRAFQKNNPNGIHQINPQEVQILHSKNLKDIHYKNNNFITRNNRPLNELTKNKFYVEKLNLSPSKHECGCLLKKWAEIPGREPSPVRTKMSLNEDQFEISQKLRVSQSNNSFENIQSEMKDNENICGVNKYFTQSVMKETEIICGVNKSLDRNKMEENKDINKENEKSLENWSDEENVGSNVEINRLNQSVEEKVEIDEFATTESLFPNNEENKNVDGIEKSFNESIKKDKENFIQNINGNKTIDLNNADVECEIPAEKTIEIVEECKASSRLLSTKSSRDNNQQSNRVTNATNSITHQPIVSRKKIRSPSPDLFDTDEDSLTVDGENIPTIQHENIPTTIQMKENHFVDLEKGEDETPGILVESEKIQNERTISEGNITLGKTEMFDEREFPEANVKPAENEKIAFFNNPLKTLLINQEFETSQKKLSFVPIKKSLDEEEPPAKKRRTLENIFSASLLSNLHDSSSEEVSDCELIESDKGILHFESFHTDAADHTIEIISSDEEEEFKFKGKEAGSLKRSRESIQGNEHEVACESKKKLETTVDDIFNDATIDADFFDYQAAGASEHEGDEEYRKDDHNFHDKNGSFISANTSFVSDEELNYSSALSKTLKKNNQNGSGKEVLSDDGSIEESSSSPDRENNKSVSYLYESTDEDVKTKEDSISSCKRNNNCADEEEEYAASSQTRKNNCEDLKNKESCVFLSGKEITNDVSIPIDSSSEDEDIKEGSVFSCKRNELIEITNKSMSIKQRTQATRLSIQIDLDLHKKADYNNSRGTNSPSDSTPNTEEIPAQGKSDNQRLNSRNISDLKSSKNQEKNPRASGDLKGDKKRGRFEVSNSENSEDNETNNISMATLLKRLEFEFTGRNNYTNRSSHLISREELSDDDVVEIIDEDENPPQQLKESQNGDKEKTLEQTRIESTESDDDVEISREELSNVENSEKTAMLEQSKIGCKSNMSESDDEIVETAEREPFVDNSMMLDNLNDDYHPGDEDSIGFHVQPQVFNFVEDETHKISEDKKKVPLRIIEKIDLCGNSNSPKHQVGCMKDELIFDDNTIDYIPKESHFSAGSSDKGLRANSFFEDTFANLLEQTGVIDAIDANIGQNSNNANIERDPEIDSEFSHKNGCYETPNKKLIVRTRNVTPIPDYDSMNTPQLHKELSRFGLKKMKRKRGIDMLKYIYESTHPVLSCDTGSRCKRRKLSLDAEFAKRSCDEENVGSEKKRPDFQRDFHDENPPLQIECIGDAVNSGEREDEMIFERTRSKRIQSCQLPLHIAFYNLLSANPSIRENVLLYEPLQVEVLYGMLKENGLKYNIQDLISFLDRKCITIRMNQN